MPQLLTVRNGPGGIQDRFDLITPPSKLVNV
jgi:hypothetical protein